MSKAVSEILPVMYAKNQYFHSISHSYSGQSFGVFPLEYIRDVGVCKEWINREIIFEDFQPMWSRYLNVTDRRTERRLAVAKPRSA